MTPRNITAISGAVAALLIAILGGWIALRSDVQARMTDAQVRQIVDDKTSDKFFEVFRALQRMEGKLDRLGEEVSKQNRKGN